MIATYHDSSRHWAAGGFLSTPLDMVKFGDSHLSGEFLKPATVATLFTSQKPVDGTETGYGIGWNLVAGPSGVREVRQLPRRWQCRSHRSVGGDIRSLDGGEERTPSKQSMK